MKCPGATTGRFDVAGGRVGGSAYERARGEPSIRATIGRKRRRVFFYEAAPAVVGVAIVRIERILFPCSQNFIVRILFLVSHIFYTLRMFSCSLYPSQ